MDLRRTSTLAKAIGVLALVLLFPPVLAYSMEMPNFRGTATIGARMSAPTAVASAPDGRLYVAEPLQRNLLVYDHRGEFQQTVSGFSSPLSIAVGPQGRVFVGDAGTGSVQTLDSALQRGASLGAGNGEFGSPAGIAVDGDGVVYVADQQANQIKSYNTDGSPRGAFGTTGTAAGTLNNPVAIAVDRASATLYVVDDAVASGGSRSGGRLQAFSTSGEFQRRIGQLGPGDGTLARPMGVTTDHLGRVYVSDALKNRVQVFSPEGAFLGTLAGPGHPLRTPVGTAFDGQGKRVLVASQNTARVEVFQLVEAGYTLSIMVSGDGGGSVTPPGPVAVELGGAVTLHFQPVAGSELQRVTVDGSTVAVTDAALTLTDIGADLLVQVFFAAEAPPAPVLWTVQVSTDGNGTTQPSGSVEVENGEALAVAFTPNAGHQVSEVLADGVSTQALGQTSYTLENITSHRSLVVVFAALPAADPEAGDTPDAGPGDEDPGDLRFSDQGEGGVTDRLTGLVWAADQADDCRTARTWAQAIAYVQGLNSGAYPRCGQGHIDWHLPNARELESLAGTCGDGETVVDLCEDTHQWLTAQGFPAAHTDAVWSSTTYGQSPDRAWVLDGGAGFLTTEAKRGQGLAWPVRSATGTGPTTWQTGQTLCYDEDGAEIPCAESGQDAEHRRGKPWPDPRATDNGEGTVTDHLTGLTWLKDAACLKTSDALGPDALLRQFNVAPGALGCREYRGAYADWRLPRARELWELLEFPANQTFLTPEEPLGTYWTQEGVEHGTRVWSPDIRRASRTPEGEVAVWLVREGPVQPAAPEPQPAAPSASTGAGGGMCFLNSASNGGDLWSWVAGLLRFPAAGESTHTTPISPEPGRTSGAGHLEPRE